MPTESFHKYAQFKGTFLPAFYEYLVIISPVLIYVAVEALASGWDYLYRSPEWSIASIFLVYQSVFTYIQSLPNEKRKINTAFVGLLIIFIVLFTIIAILNSYLSLHAIEDNFTKIIVRLILLIIASIIFFLLIIASKVSSKITSNDK